MSILAAAGCLLTLAAINSVCLWLADSHSLGVSYVVSSDCLAIQPLRLLMAQLIWLHDICSVAPFLAEALVLVTSLADSNFRP